MRHDKLSRMIKGWVVGSFSPSVYETSDFEVAVKYYKQGDAEAAHYHKVATEITVIVDGVVKMRDRIWVAGDILVIEPGDVTAFEALEHTTPVVIKAPSVKDDKYLA